LGIIIQYTAIW